jgi:EthD domain
MTLEQKNGGTSATPSVPAEIWFDDVSGAKGFFESEGYIRNIIPDEEEFMDRKNCEFMWTTENAVII